jgi:5-methylcytosine-specific restriction endonuclease McrA
MDKKKARRDARVALAECPACYGKLNKRQKLCTDCRARKTEQTKSRRKELVANGKCHNCRKPRLPGATRCETCIFKEKAMSYLGARSHWETIKAIWDKQGGVCPYTGLTINLITAELDHIIPRARGGGGDLSNLHFVFADANRMKKDHFEPEFFSLIKTMYLHLVSTGKIKEEPPVPDLKIAQ